ncbi:hypothetical protein VKT23_007781 [Stygiomarasmius scandens]|uniref:MFS transporter n=1 Tax=Marasmiellus scandens TaxID=2682957 RepID=A0ABR1JIZ6_9AGAR
MSSELQRSTGIDPTQLARFGARVLLNQIGLSAEQLARLAAGALLTVGSTIILPSIGIAVINAIGFTSAGVAAGSLAATIQSVFCGAFTGGLFSAFQSLGATAVIASPPVLGVGAALVIIGGVAYVVSKVRESRRGVGL